MLKLAAIAIVAGMLTACAGATIPGYSGGNVAQEAPLNLCIDYYALSHAGLINSDTARKAAIRAELSRRGEVSGSEWALIDKETIRTGMGACATLASWGLPDNWNQAAVAGSNIVQLVYSGNGYSGQYVYLESGRVTSFQNSF